MMFGSFDSGEKVQRYLKEIPYINFPSEWAVQITPPFAGATARFRARYKGEEISVYLDFNDALGSFGGGGEPYWEAYPCGDDIERFALNDTLGLIEAMKKEFTKNEETEKQEMRQEKASE